jgi:hypothetical protein
MTKSRIHHGLALASAATLVSLSCGALAGSAAAEPGKVHEDHGKHAGQGKHEPKGDDGDKGDKGAEKPKHHGHAYGQAHAAGQQADHGNGTGTSQGDEHGDPPGNNGTVKIAGPGDAVGHPSNNPHPGCTFDVEWFGFDQGDDVVSTVTFTAQAPTSDVTIGGTSPGQVFVGGDPAGGGTDLDGRQAYTLTFSGGEPHPKQGYHVKLTVATPYSLGNDTKTKVFWVAPCEEGGTTGASSHHAAAGGGRGHQGPGDRGVEAAAETLSTESPDAGSGAGSGVGPGDTAAVPTSVDAGEDAPVLPDWARSPLPLAAVAGGLALVAAGLVLRNRSGA